MKAFISFCVLFGAALGYHIPAPLDKEGIVMDTPEVAAEKSAHYLKLAKAGGAIPKDAHFTHEYQTSHPEHDYRYHGPPAPLKHDGTVDETPEVKHVKAERLATLSEAFAKVHHNHHSLHKRSSHYYEPAPLNHDGTVDETPEVKHIKSARLAALAEGFAKAKKGYGYETEDKKYKGPPAPLKHDGTVDETPEVKHLKYEHLATVAHAFAKAPQGHDEYEKSDEYEKHEYPEEIKTYKYHGPEAPLKHDGTVDETPEVKHIKSARLATLSEAFAKAGYHKLNKRSLTYYHGPPAPLNHDGTVDETPEVKHVKAARLAALSEAFAKAPHGYEHYEEEEKYVETKKYHGPPAPLNHDGTVAETPEVKHVKAEHLAAVKEALAKAPHGYEHHEYETKKYHESPLSYDIHHEEAKKYHGPPAPLNHDGTVAETPEVKHVKSARLSALSEAYSKAPKDEHHHIYKRSAHYDHYDHYEQEEPKKYHGPPAPLNHDGTVDETPEVKHVKAEHLAAVHEAFAKAPHGYEHHEYETKKYHESPQSHDEYHHEKTKKYHGPPAPLNHDGTVAETPEVKHVKAEHLAAVKEAFAKATHGYEHHEYETKKYHESPLSHDKYYHEEKYHGPPAPLNHDGTVAETPEVKHVKSARLSTLSEAYSKAPKDEHHHLRKRSAYYDHYDHYEQEEPKKYHGPPAPLNHDGTVDETPEVKHVKAERLSALKEAFAKAPHGYDEYHKEDNVEKYNHDEYHHEETKKYHGPSAPLNHDGTVAETPEVKHVKAEHLAAVKEAFAKAPHGYEHHEYETKKYHESPLSHREEKYHGPPAPLNHDGTVAETPEVKHVKSARLSTLSEAYAKAPQDKHHLYKRSAHYGYHGPPAPLNHDGTVDETPEVKHLKAEHLAALKEAFAKAPKQHKNEISHQHKYPSHEEYVDTKKYQGPPAPLNHDGTVAETPEVSHVKSERLAALHEAYAKAPQDKEYTYEPKSYPIYVEKHQEKHYVEPAPLNHDGTVAETPEVQARKYEHLAAHHKTLASLG